MKVTNRFKGLDLVECLKNYRQKFIHCTGGGDQSHSKKKKYKKEKWLYEEALQIAEKKRKVKSKGERERYTQLDSEL